MGSLLGQGAFAQLVAAGLFFSALSVVFWLIGRRLGRAGIVPEVAGAPHASVATITPRANVEPVRGPHSLALNENAQADLAGFVTPARVVLFKVAADATSGMASESVPTPMNSEIILPGLDDRRSEPMGVAIQEITAQPVEDDAADKGWASARDAGAPNAGAAPGVRRRPRPAWELALDGQTPATLLARAHERLAAGAHREAADQLRACAQLASKLKDIATEAVARLELGDLARVSGDMTTACEHWQLARSLYADLKRADEVAGAAKRMEMAGCPTDWVLTKF